MPCSRSYYKMRRPGYIFGFRKWRLDVIVSIRLCVACVKAFGLLRFAGELKKYLGDNRNIFKDIPNRYVIHDKNIYAVPDLPPVNSSQFIQYLVNDIQAINHNKKLPLLFAIVCISSSCPYSCYYCYNSSEHSQEQKISLPRLEYTIQGLIESGVKNIYLSGGEPMMRWDALIHLLTKFQNRNVRFWLITTGWGIDKNEIKILKNLGLTGLMISLDSEDPNRIDLIKGKNAFQNSVDAIKSAVDGNLMVAIDCVMGKDLLMPDSFNNFVRFVGNLGASFINCYTPKTIINSNTNAVIHFNLEEYRHLAELSERNLKGKNSVKMPLAYAPDIWEMKRGCMGGKLFIYISPDGNVKLCPFQKKVFGNIVHENIEVILKVIGDVSNTEVCKTNELLSESMKIQG